MNTETPLTEVIEDMCRCQAAALTLFVRRQPAAALPGLLKSCRVASNAQFTAHWRNAAAAMRYKQPADPRDYVPAERARLQRLLDAAETGDEGATYSTISDLPLEHLDAYGYIVEGLKFAVEQELAGTEFGQRAADSSE